MHQNVCFLNPLPGNSNVLSRLRSTEGDQYKEIVIKVQNRMVFEI